MRCLSCNCLLTDKESTRKYRSDHTFVDLCNRCFNSSDMSGIDIIEGTGGEDDEYIDEWEGPDDDDWSGNL